MLRCPVCREKIEKSNEKTYVCQNRHSFDISKKGYVNFLLCNQMRSKLPGDNKLMVDARENFLAKGYYSSFLEALKNVIDTFQPTVILDAGCGEGYYTNGIYKPNRKITGIDISKSALQKAAPKNRDITFIAASLFNLPIGDSEIDLLFSLFAPYAGDEFYRVLKKDGIMVLGIPGADHLFELKSVIYNTPYQNQVKEYALEDFTFLESKKLHKKIKLKNREDILHLFQMTPYYYRTKKEDIEKINTLEEFEVTISFELLIYKK